MKNNFCVTTLILFIAFGFLMSCNPDQQGQFEGKWRWVKSVGGYAGHTLTPESEGMKKTLKISPADYAEYRDDSLLYKVPYKLVFKTDSVFRYDTIMVINEGIGLGLRVKRDTLEIKELCFDCYQHFYVRD